MSRFTRSRGGLWVPRQTCRRLAGPTTSTSPSGGSDSLTSGYLLGDNFSSYEDTTALKNNIRYNLGTPVGPAGSLYYEGNGWDHIHLDTDVTYNGRPTCRFDQPAGGNISPNLFVALDTETYLETPLLTSWWIKRKLRRSANYTLIGSEGELGTPQPAQKLLGWFWPGYGGRGGLDMNGDQYYAHQGPTTSGTPLSWVEESAATIRDENLGAIGSNGFREITLGATPGDEAWYDEITLNQQSGGTITTRLWIGRDGDDPIEYRKSGGAIMSGTLTGGLTLPGIWAIQLNINYNQTRTTLQKFWMAQWEIHDAATSPNPFGLL